MGFTISTKRLNSLPPGNYLCCLLLQEQIDPTVWTDGITIGQAKMSFPFQIKLKNPSVSTPKTISSQV
jgi:hypothetical protein